MEHETCDVVQERCLNEQWDVNDDGSIDSTGFRGDGGSSEFSNYLCLTHDFDSESWVAMQVHMKEHDVVLDEFA